MTDEEIREIKSRSLLGSPTAIDIGKLISEISKLKGDLESMEHKFNLHHDFYKCVPSKVVDQHIDEISNTVHDFLISSINLTSVVKMNSPLCAEIFDFEELAKVQLVKLRNHRGPWNRIRE